MENTEEIKETEQNAEVVQKQMELSNKITAMLARNEAVNIIVEILNAIFTVTQNSDNKISEEILTAIQNAVNIENEKTNLLFTDIQNSMNSSCADSAASNSEVEENKNE